MASEPQEIVTGKNLAAKSSEVDFAIVLSRVIASIENDPAQLRNAVYELARIKLQTEQSESDAPINVTEKGDVASALEASIETVETFYSHRQLTVLASPDRLTKSSEAGVAEITIKKREPTLMIRAGSLHTTHLPNFLSGVVGGSRKVKPSWYWTGAVPLLKAAIVAIFAVGACAVLDRQLN